MRRAERSIKQEQPTRHRPNLLLRLRSVRVAAHPITPEAQAPSLFEILEASRPTIIEEYQAFLTPDDPTAKQRKHSLGSLRKFARHKTETALAASSESSDEVRVIDKASLKKNAVVCAMLTETSRHAYIKIAQQVAPVYPEMQVLDMLHDQLTARTAEEVPALYLTDTAIALAAQGMAIMHRIRAHQSLEPPRERQ